MAAKIKIDIDRKQGKIDPKIFGHFIEHLGRCIYGGIYDEGNSLSDARGFRKDVLQAVKDLRVPILRWPGGNFASGYHWMDGIGPKDKRPRRMELAWHAVESNRFGTDEFLTYCAEIGAEPYICINMGNGTMDEAAAWVEYCNGTADTYYANLRRANGREEPYGVKYWGLGNEVYGQWQIGHKSAEDYAKAALEYAKVMKWVDPNISLIACGANDPDWDRTVLERLINYVDYISIHIYVGPRGEDKYYSLVANSELIERRLRILEGVIEAAMAKARRSKPLYIAFDEWNVWYREHGNGLEEKYDLADALMVASFLNSFIRHADTVKIANLAQMVNVIGAIFTSPDDMYLQTIYHPVKVYRDLNSGYALEIYVECETFSAGEYGAVPLLDVSGSYDPQEGKVVLNVVNRHKTEAVEAEIINQEGELTAPMTVYEINGISPESSNSFEQKEVVKAERRIVEPAFSNGRFVYRFPAHSVTCIQFSLAS